MSKAVLVMDMPSSCDECPLLLVGRYCKAKEAPNGEYCFGCYINGEYEIYIADNIPTDQLFHTIAHEYMHYLQDIEGKESDEKEANDFAWSVFTPCYLQGKKDLADKLIEKFESEKNREKPFSVTNLLWQRAINLVKEISG